MSIEINVTPSSILLSLFFNFAAATVVASKNCEADGLSRRHHGVLG